jgi:hypothetical protein
VAKGRQNARRLQPGVVFGSWGHVFWGIRVLFNVLLPRQEFLEERYQMFRDYRP